MIDPVGSAGATEAAAAAATRSANATINQQEFLTLFIAQLQHQDPLSPLEPNELTAQLAQFASLEQLTGINDRLDGLARTKDDTTGAAVLGLIGRTVTFEGSRLALADGEATAIGYALEQPAARVTATVRAADGQVVRTLDLGAQEAGAQRFEFDGKTTLGTALPDGTYRVEITARYRDTTEETALALAAEGTVDGVDLATDPPALLVGGLRLELADVRQVRATGSED